MMEDGVQFWTETVIDPSIAGRSIQYFSEHFGNRVRTINAATSQEKKEQVVSRGIRSIRFMRRVRISIDPLDTINGIPNPKVNVDRVEVDCRTYYVTAVKPIGGGAYAFLDVQTEAMEEGQTENYRGF